MIETLGQDLNRVPTTPLSPTTIAQTCLQGHDLKMAEGYTGDRKPAGRIRRGIRRGPDLWRRALEK
jgi:hypothetical protein